MREILPWLFGIDPAGLLPAAVGRLLLAAFLGGLIGFEREVKQKPAGLRTNMFICFGAAMFTILSDQLAGQFSGDHTRIAAQIIPGIGFIGAGSILINTLMDEVAFRQGGTEIHMRKRTDSAERKSTDRSATALQ